MDIAKTPVTALKGVGPKVKEKLARLGISTIQDVLFHLPARYQDRTRLTPIGALKPGSEALITGEIELADVLYRRRRSLVCRLSDRTGFVHLRFFHFSAAQQQQLARGNRLRCFGEARFGPLGLEMAHPEYSVLRAEEPALAEASLTPVYPATAGLHQLSLRRITQQALDRYAGEIADWLPVEYLYELKLPSLGEALMLVHRPPPAADSAALLEGSHPAIRRLALEELTAHFLGMRRLRERSRSQRAQALNVGGALAARMLSSLPFALTGAQRRVLDEIRAELKRPYPMQRLVQGDVGCGKTIVAAAAGLDVIEGGAQVAVMAPTELLAEQHLKNFSRWLAPLGVRVIGLSSKLRASARREAVAAIAGGEAAMVVGTHALFQEDVRFARLALMVVDEQHRFGVDQRLALREKGTRDGAVPHQLIMTATPIPRTLAQTVYADLDVSVIDELPPGRTPVETVAVPMSRRPEVVARVREACLAGRQAYWVCPLIEESEAMALETATQTAEALREALPELMIALVHGRLRPQEKERIMAAFKAGDAHVLVATTVIEVGVDVPRASLMIIENAERLGLSQLHQLRGRVGRGAERSSCVLLYQPPLAELARARLAVLRDSNNGFEIARKDLEMRGPGELLGTQQTGMQGFRIAELMRDQALIPRAQGLAERLAADRPENVEPLIRRWLPLAENYADV